MLNGICTTGGSVGSCEPSPRVLLDLHAEPLGMSVGRLVGHLLVAFEPSLGTERELGLHLVPK
jgi:hypothetical protein